jgi:hypothetical protein
MSLRTLIAALTAAGILATPGCATLKTMSGDFATCGKADLGQFVGAGSGSAGETLLEYVTQVILDNGANLETTLLQLAGQLGLDAVECAVASVEEVAKGAVGSEEDATQTPGLVRAHAMIAKQRAAKAAK